MSEDSVEKFERWMNISANQLETEILNWAMRIPNGV